MTTDLGLANLGSRCEHGYAPEQSSLHECLALKSAGQSRATAAHPTEAAAVDAAIRQLAATGEPFSSNDARPLHGVTGPVVGARFTAMRKAGLIVHVGYEQSSKASTHAHPVAIWRAA